MRLFWILLFVFIFFNVKNSTAQTKPVAEKPFRIKPDNPWKKNDKMLLGFYWLGSFIDAGQTIYGLRHGAAELNPVLGKSPGKVRIYSLKIAAGALATVLCHKSNSSDRKYMLGLINAIQWSAVLWNGQFAGVGLRLHF